MTIPVSTSTTGPDVTALVTSADDALREGNYTAAVTALDQLVQVKPDDVRLLLNLGGALKELGHFDAALPVLVRAVGLDPQRPGAWSNLGTVCLELQRYDDAVASFANALRLKPDHGPALSGMGVTLRRRGLPQQALSFFDPAVAAAPHDAELRTNRSLAYLAAGDYQRGFMEYEWRLHTQTFTAGLPKGPSWKGEPLAGRTLLLHGEGGLGDILQFCRFIPMLRQMDCLLVMQVPSELVRLMSRTFGIPVRSTEDPPLSYDLFCTLMSLPYAVGMTVETIPFPGGYLCADPDIVSAWRTVLDCDLADRAPEEGVPSSRLKVGLVWAGGKRPWHLHNWLMDGRRSTSLSNFAPLAACADEVLFYSLQLGGPAAEAESSPPGLNLIDHTARIVDFEDTAALVSLLDLVIAVDTSTAHLAAALGRPVWLLSRYDQCWRWVTGRVDSPWYSTMQVFIQPEPFNWEVPVARIAAELQSLAGNSMSVDERRQPDARGGQVQDAEKGQRGLVLASGDAP